jgi:hypothetical protein
LESKGAQISISTKKNESRKYHCKMGPLSAHAHAHTEHIYIYIGARNTKIIKWKKIKPKGPFSSSK